MIFLLSDVMGVVFNGFSPPHSELPAFQWEGVAEIPCFCRIIGSFSGGQWLNINQFDFPTSLELLCAWSRSQGLELGGNSWVEMGAEASPAGAEHRSGLVAVGLCLIRVIYP